MASAARKLNLRHATVLVVDDNPISLDLTKQILKGFRIEKLKDCRSASDARAMINREQFDLLLLDGEMIGEGGIELSRFIRSGPDGLNFTAPIVLISAFTPLTTVRCARDTGINMVVAKPVSPTALLNRIEWIARTQRSFVASESYCGPDRRFRRGSPPEETGERRSDTIALVSEPQREMSQNELDSLFG